MYSWQINHMNDKQDYQAALVDEQALTEYLETHLGAVDEYSMEYHSEGHSNETLFVTWGAEELVLRRPPPGETADTAHDVVREYRIMDALQDTPIPVPETLLACEDESIIGGEFYVMAREKGEVIRDKEPERFASPNQRRRIGEELVDSLVSIHTVDYEAVGLGDIGQPDGYIKRQVDRWDTQFEWALGVTKDERGLPERTEITKWLQANCPDSSVDSLVHGDYKPDNVIFSPGDEPVIGSVFDWELSTLGDPRFDLGWLLSYWRHPDDPPPAVSELYPRFMEVEGYPTRQELVDRYERQVGIEFANERFYRALAVYKLGALGEMFFRRHLEGNANNSMYPKMREGVPMMLDRAKRIIDGNEPL